MQFWHLNEQGGTSCYDSMNIGFTSKERLDAVSLDLKLNTCLHGHIHCAFLLACS